MVSLEFAAKGYNIPVESVQKETASLLKRGCRARATHPSAVDYMITKQRSEVTKKAAAARCGINQSG